MKCSLLDWHHRRVNRRLLGVRVRHMKQLQMNEIRMNCMSQSRSKKRTPTASIRAEAADSNVSSEILVFRSIEILQSTICGRNV